MATWPDTAELKQILDVTSEDTDDTLDRVMAAAIKKVKKDVGNWDEAVDEPDDSLVAGALRMAELMALRPFDPAGFDRGSARAIARDPAYQSYLFGHRRKFGIS